MKRVIGSAAAMVLVASQAMGYTINLDFQPDINDQIDVGRIYSVDYTGTAAAPDSGVNWNHLVPDNPSPRAFEGTPGYFDFVEGPLTYTDIVDSFNNTLSGVQVNVGNTFGAFSSTEDSITDADTFAGLDKVSAQAQDMMRDYLIANDDNPGTVTISGLPAGQEVVLYLYGEGDNPGDFRQTRFDANGIIGSTLGYAGDPHTMLTEGSDYVVLRNVYADATGEINITYSPSMSGGEGPFNGLQLTTVPEPGTSLLLGLAGIGLMAIRRKR